MPSAKTTLKQIEGLNIIKNKPLIITDVDEVLVYFAQPLEEFLQNQGMSISFTSYRLFGNIRYHHNNQIVEQEKIMEMLNVFFFEEIHTCPPVKGACEALKNLEDKFQIVILTNTPPKAKSHRIEALQNIGIDYQMVANEGKKGLAVKEMSAKTNEQSIFIDDIPHHHTSVAGEANHVHRIHFVADNRLAKLLPQADDSHQRIDKWDEVEKYINSNFS